MDPAPPSAAADPAGSGAPTRQELDGMGAPDGGCGDAEGSAAARPVVPGLGDLGAGIPDLLGQAEACLHPCAKDTQLTAEVSVEKPHGSDPLSFGKENAGTNIQSKPDAEHGENRLSAARLALDLNTVDNSDAAEHNPFFPYKKLGQSRVSDPSECGSTTGAIEESESYRKWREMKQNGFLSSSHGKAMVPRPRGRPPKRKRDDEVKKNISTQHGQANKFVKVAAPSGLLSGLNPGIINHDGDGLKLQLSSAVNVSSDRTCSTSADDLASNHDYMTVLSVKAATVASQWLELLHQDIRGRLAGIILKSQENRLKQVQEMQLNCDKGLQHMSCDAPLLGPMAELWKLKNPDISESEWAVQAAAASIYSTCNMVLRTENVPCF
nr:unnamed protein product [Digitaria exilis]